MTESVFEKVVLYEAFSTHTDRNQFLAFMFLKKKYPELTYWSHNGYDCDALANYTINIVWNRNEIIDWRTKEKIRTTNKSFYDCSMTEIIDIWTDIEEYFDE